MKNLHDIFTGSIKLGEMQSFGGMCVFPIFLTQETKVLYLSLKQALNQHLILITEISEGGSVPELRVRNNADLPVLLLDGEEISGAKQNRILNTSILLKEHSETIIPVSCTESGRWAYNKPHFDDSDIVMSAKIRSSKLDDVTQNLKTGGQFRSDQGKVWDEINTMACEMSVSSPTSAMKDVFDASQKRLKDYAAEFPLQEEQTGLVVCFEDKVIGLDCLSSKEVWADLHEKLIKSYAVDCLRGKLKDCRCSLEQVHDFLERFHACTFQSFNSIGYGDDYRFESPEIIGSGLFWQDAFIHLELYSRKSQVFETRYHSPRHRI